MKKIFAVLAVLFLGLVKLHADSGDFGARPISSFTAVATLGPVMFSSGTIEFIGIVVSSPSSVAGGNDNPGVIVYRSTTSSFTNDIATQTRVDTAYTLLNAGGIFIPMFDLTNDSYTYVQITGNAKITTYFKCPDPMRCFPNYGLQSNGSQYPLP